MDDEVNPNESIWDRRQALERLDGDIDLLREVSSYFLADAPVKVAAIRDAVARGDLGSARMRAHALKGNCGTVGAVACENAASLLERALCEGCRDEACALLGRVSECLDALLPLFSDGAGERPGSGHGSMDETDNVFGKKEHG